MGQKSKHSLAEWSCMGFLTRQQSTQGCSWLMAQLGENPLAKSLTWQPQTSSPYWLFPRDTSSFPCQSLHGVVCSTAAGFQQSEQEEARGSLRCASTPWPHHGPCCHSAAGWTESGVTFWKFSYDACLVAATGGAETVCPLSQCLINSHLFCSENEGPEVGLTSLLLLVTS